MIPLDIVTVCVLLLFFFFFQAEDGIRDLYVTGVQTCALPILPMERAHELLRPLASEADMSRVQKTLGADHAVSRDRWLSRRRDSQAKLTGGDPIGLAEIIRDSARREWALAAKGTKSRLSPGERE